MSLKTGGGLTVRPGGLLASGGQGEVFEVTGPGDVVFKRYLDTELTKDPTLEDRLRVMVANRPEGWREAGSGHVLLTWPGDVVADDERFVGFLMPRVDPATGVRLLRVSDPSDRSTATDSETWLRGFTWKYLVTTAANLALGVEVLHDEDVVIGDFNDANVVVTNRAQVTLLDCDSMQFTDPADGKRFLCRVFRPDFLAPELAGADLKKTFRPKSSDLFTLAVHIHMLLLQGEHPFRGQWLGKGDPPPETQLAARGLWTHAGTSEIGPRRSAIGINLLTKDVIALFRRAFVDGATAPGRRPDAETWRTTLENLSHHLTQCRTETAHWYPEHHRHCPWCAHGHLATALPQGQTALAPLAPVRLPAPVTVAKPRPPTPIATPSPPVTHNLAIRPPVPVASTPAKTSPKRAIAYPLRLMVAFVALTLLVVVIAALEVHHSVGGSHNVTPNTHVARSSTSSGRGIRLSVSTKWSSTASENGSTRGLSYVSCATRTFCVAATFSEIYMYNGTSWSPGPILAKTGISSVSCPSTSFCMAVDTNGNAYMYNGTSWSTPEAVTKRLNGTTFGASSTMLTSVSCPNSSFCVALDGWTGGPSAYTYNDGTWSGPVPINVSSGEVSCGSSSLCMATSGNVFVYNGTDWSSTPGVFANTTTVSVSTISCVGNSFCMAISQRQNLVAIYNGNGWSHSKSIASSQFTLIHVSCSTDYFCIAFGTGGTSGAVMMYDRGRWEVVNGVFPNSVSSLSCPSTNFCMAITGNGDATAYSRGT